MSRYDDWVEVMNKHLKGKKIVNVRLLTNEEAEHLGWYNRSVVLELEGGIAIWPSRDDEGNDCGSLFTTIEELPTLPAFGMEE